MRKIFFISIFLLVLNFSLKAQILQQPNTYGIGWKRTGADTLLYIPSDTLSVPSWGVGKTHIARKGTTLYYWDGSKWSAITPTLQQVLTAGSTLTTNHTIDFGGNDLKIKGDSLQIVNTDGNVRIKLIPSAGGVGSAATRLTFINADAAEMFIQSGDEYLETYSGWYIRNEIGNNPALSVNGKTGGQTAPYIEVLQGAGKLFEIGADSFSINPPLGVLNIDSLRTWSGISDTTYKKPMTWDTRNGRWEYAANWPQQKISLVFGAGSGADSDTTAFTTSAIYGSFYNDADTIVVTSMRSVLQGTSPDVTYKVWYNDSLNVEAGATALVTAGSQVTNTTTGTNVTSFDATKIPPGVWVWVKTSTVATKPKYFSLTVNGYRK